MSNESLSQVVLDIFSEYLQLLRGQAVTGSPGGRGVGLEQDFVVVQAVFRQLVSLLLAEDFGKPEGIFDSSGSRGSGSGSPS